MNPYVLLAAFRKDIDRHRAELAGIWGGPLCMVEYSRSEAELTRIQDEVHSPESGLGLEVLWSATDVLHNRVEIGVVVFDEKAQTILDKRYGIGVVHQVPSLTPVD